MIFPFFYQTQSGRSMCFSCNNTFEAHDKCQFSSITFTALGLHLWAQLSFLHTSFLKRLSLCSIVSQWHAFFSLVIHKFFGDFFFLPNV